MEIMMKKVFSKVLIQAIKERLERKEQVILLLNRRGYSSYVTCSHCGHIFTCPSCRGNLTYHRHDELLKCHQDIRLRKMFAGIELHKLSCLRSILLKLGAFDQCS